MATFLLFGKYSLDSVGDISSERTVEAESVMKKFGGSYQSGYAMLGDTDLLLIGYRFQPRRP